MASIKHINGKWHAQVNKQGVRKAKSFHSKSEANNWATRLELEIDTGSSIGSNKRTLGNLLFRYADKVTIGKKSRKWELKKINHIARDFGHIKLSKLDGPAIAEWRDIRLKSVKPATVNREWNLLNAAINTAIREWKWLQKNPMENIKRPPRTRPRDRLVSDHEIELILTATGYENSPNTVASRVAAAFLFAIETAMRAGEIASLNSDTVDLVNRVCTLPETKNGTKRRVPLSLKAVSILRTVNLNFDLSTSQIDANFRKYRDAAGIKGLTFHDSRHQAITNLAQKVEVLDLARRTGITDLKVLMVYYNQTAEKIAKLLD
jgi:integrase